MSSERRRSIRRKTWWVAALGAASFVLLDVFYVGEMLIGNRPTPDSILEWAVLAIVIAPFYLLLGLVGEMVLEALVGLLKIPFDSSSTSEESRWETPQTPEEPAESPWRGFRALVMLLVGLCLIPVLYFGLVFIYSH